MTNGELGWYGVRCLFRWRTWDGKPYEERITLWRAHSLDQAIELAEEDAADYADRNEIDYLHLSQAYALDPGSRIESGLEVFSLLRDSALPPQEYLDRFYDTGTEHTQSLASGIQLGVPGRLDAITGRIRVPRCTWILPVIRLRD
jgi:hypothetical protein